MEETGGLLANLSDKDQEYLSGKVTFSVILECCNQSYLLENTLFHWHLFFRSQNIPYEIILINNGSTDGSSRILDKVRREIRNLRVIHQLRTLKSESLKRGASVARGKYVVFFNHFTDLSNIDFEKLFLSLKSSMTVGYFGDTKPSAFQRGFQKTLQRWSRLWGGTYPLHSKIQFILAPNAIFKASIHSIPTLVTNPLYFLSLILFRNYPNELTELFLPSMSAPKKSWYNQFKEGWVDFTTIPKLKFQNWLNPLPSQAVSAQEPV